ncbi:DUF169 domain-containing protein [Peptoclostridium litorale]|uniref:DUF169 domain-containing protein n=1 Tax=Peptoclostridium litorale TaxID=1557 RepID=UPI0009823667|nr:DUF169 domain-containing protein [Peptoclostridium litorale]
MMKAAFLFTKEDFVKEKAKTIANTINYCVLVKSAMEGHDLKVTGDQLACKAGAKAIGLIEMDDYHISGQNGKKLGLYHNQVISKNVRERMAYCNHSAYGVLIKPIESYTDEEEPDVVLIVTRPYQVMRIVQSYSHYYGLQPAFQITGNQAICSESTAFPYMNGSLNVSMLCIGTRHRAKWDDDEMAVAFPFHQLEKVSDGLMKTINIMDDNGKKKVVEKKMDQCRLQEPKIKYDFNYYNLI